MKTQDQMFYDATRKAAELNQAFLDMVADGMTRRELQALIDKRPNIYGRFAHWLEKLPA